MDNISAGDIIVFKASVIWVDVFGDIIDIEEGAVGDVTITTPISLTIRVGKHWFRCEFPLADVFIKATGKRRNVIEDERAEAKERPKKRFERWILKEYKDANAVQNYKRLNVLDEVLNKLDELGVIDWEGADRHKPTAPPNVLGEN